MQSIKNYKERALANLENRWFDAAIVALVYYIIYQGINWLVTTFMSQESGLVFNFIWILACMPLTWSFAVMFLDFIRGEKLESGKLFEGYKDLSRVFVTYLLYFIAVTIGLILFFVPGIIIAFMFAQTPYILRDDKDLGAIDVLKKSADMMKGHKMQLFLLYLSFIGWAILAVLTLGIGFLFLSPYINTTLAHYYEDLKKESF